MFWAWFREELGRILGETGTGLGWIVGGIVSVSLIDDGGKFWGGFGEELGRIVVGIGTGLGWALGGIASVSLELPFHS